MNRPCPVCKGTRLTPKGVYSCGSCDGTGIAPALVCMPNPAQWEYSLCGDAWDCDFETGEGDTRHGDPGEKITCPKCLNAINYCKTVKHNRVPDAIDTIHALRMTRRGGGA